MSPAAVDIVKEAYAAYGKGDWDGVASLCAEDTQWTVHGNTKTGLPWMGTHRGHEGVKKGFMEAMNTHARVDKFDIITICEDKTDASTVVVKGAWYATMKNDSGEPVQGCSVVMPWVHWWSVKAGKIQTYEHYSDQTDAIAAWKKVNSKDT